MRIDIPLREGDHFPSYIFFQNWKGEKRIMKKNKLMRLASGLMVLSLLTTCAISGTFAKYTRTAASDEQSARVAKWGLGATETTIDLFSDTYDTTDGGSVDGNGDKVIAPGTGKTSNLYFVSKDGKAPEVAYKLSVSVAAESTSDDDATATQDISTNPNIKWQVGDQKDLSWDDFKTAVANLAKHEVNGEATDEYAPNSLPEQLKEDTATTIGWYWAFDETDTKDKIGFEVENNNDEQDTAMGDDAAYLTAASVKLTFTITATQIDTYGSAPATAPDAAA
jgi:hypothetical protein